VWIKILNCFQFLYTNACRHWYYICSTEIRFHLILFWVKTPESICKNVILWDCDSATHLQCIITLSCAYRCSNDDIVISQGSAAMHSRCELIFKLVNQFNNITIQLFFKRSANWHQHLNAGLCTTTLFMVGFRNSLILIYRRVHQYLKTQTWLFSWSSGFCTAVGASFGDHPDSWRLMPTKRSKWWHARLKLLI